MRLHELTITAFGPFAERVVVDFDALSDAGLFLLTGDTGSGKSSVLDAVCFALYGDVPGDRALARRLRSDHASPGVPPEVTLEFSARGRRFGIVRSPAWVRPKKRGDGTTQVPARVVCTELVAGQWHPVSHRIDEVSHLMRRLLGLTMTQFVQVAMLPQGQFQAFLRASSDERHRLLQQLFQTDRYERIETWLREHRRDLHRTSQRHEADVAAVLHRVCEGAAIELPEGWVDAEQWVRSGQLCEWFDELHHDLDRQREVATQRQHRSTEAAAEASLTLAQLRTLLQQRELGERAQQVLLEAEAESSALAEARQRHEAAQLSAELQPWRDIVEQRRQHHRRVERTAAEALATMRSLLGADLDSGQLLPVHDAISARVSELRSLVPVSRRYGDLAQRHKTARQEATSLADDLAGARAACEQAPQQVAQASAAATAAHEAWRALPAAAQRLQVLRDRLAAQGRAARLSAELDQAASQLLDAKSALHHHTETWLHIREARLDGMAAEMARSLAAGCACPVCGSADHPHPAQASINAPDLAAEKAARTLVDDAEIVAQVCADHVSGLSAQLDIERAAVGDPSELADPDVLIEAQQRHDSLFELAQREEATQAALQQAETALAARQASVHELETALAASRSRLTVLTEELRDAEVTLSSAVPDPRRLDAVLAECVELAGLSAGAIEAHRQVGEARASVEAALTDADHQSRLRGFAALREADAALLEPRELQLLQTRLADHERRVRHATDVLRRPEVGAALSAPAPDLAAATATAQQTQQQARADAAALDHLERVCARTRELAHVAHQLVESWLPVLQSLDVATSLSAFVEGKSPDNRLAMRLSAFVLGHRLAQVVAAANQRLGPMSDQRFTLTHSQQRGAGERRGGLSLLVHDEWSGETRDPTTLSGGETFVVSLALALGLADVIAHEAGGADLETLFVDEGFGSLDGDTLDLVLDVLDSLRDGGRTVGVVSHVAEMRDRITTRLHVHKSRSGSRLSLELA